MVYIKTITATLLVLGVLTSTAVGHTKCHTHSCKVRVANKYKMKVVAPYRARFLSIAACESGGRWGIATGNGFYGGLQFTVGSWHAVGGRGYPHWASKLEQLYRGVLLMRKQGWGAWPVCQYA